jgi:hypothetical protein
VAGHRRGKDAGSAQIGLKYGPIEDDSSPLQRGERRKASLRYEF